MKTALKLAPALLLALGATTALPAAAQRYAGGQPYYTAYDQNHRGHDRDRYDDRGRRYHGNGHWDNGRRGPPPWARGRDYRSYGYGNVYVVPARQYRNYRLYAPRPGYRWVRDDRGNYLMVAIATGIIADVLLHH